MTPRLPRPETLLAGALLVCLVLLPLPFGGARPLFQALFAIALGLIGTGYALARRPGLKWPAPLPLLLGLLAIVLAALCLQMVPFGDIFFDLPLGVIRASTLSLAPGETLMMLIRQLTYALLFVLVLAASDAGARAGGLLHLLLAIISVQAVIALAAPHLPSPGIPLLQLVPVTVSGTFVNRNHFATYMAIGLVAAFAVVASHRRESLLSWRAGSVAGAGAVMAAALIGTQSRGGLAAAGLGIAGVLILATLRRVRRTGAVLWAALLGGVIFLGLLYTAAERLGAAASDPRLTLYAQVLEMIAARPWLGFGGGSFELAFPAFRDAALSTELVWNSAHSTYLELWADLGLIVGTIPVVMLAVLANSVWRGFWRGDEGPAPLAALGATIVVAIHALVDFSMEIPAVTATYLAVLALGAAASTATTQNA